MTAIPSNEHLTGPVLLCAGTDPAAAARLAEATASLLADRPVVVLATWEPPPAGLDSLIDALYGADEDPRASGRHAATEVVEAACEVLEAHRLHATRQVVPEESSPWQVILRVADQIDAAAIVAGTSERPPAHPGAIGGEARALAHRTRRPLLLLPPDAAPAAVAAPALFAFDGSATATRALAAATQLLRPRPAVVASVWQTASALAGAALLAVPDEVARKGIAALDEASHLQAEGQASDGAARLAADGWHSEIAALETARNVPSAIVETAAEHDAAVLVTGTRGRSRVAAALLGSAAEAIVRGAGRPVLLVPPAPK
jgi:nucleotide-binding universal stress UspA family protein